MYDVSYFEARGKHMPLGMYGGGEVDPQVSLARKIGTNFDSGAWRSAPGRSISSVNRSEQPSWREIQCKHRGSPSDLSRSPKELQETRTEITGHPQSTHKSQHCNPARGMYKSTNPKDKSKSRNYFAENLANRQEIQRSCGTTDGTPTGSWPGAELSLSVIKI